MIAISGIIAALFTIPILFVSLLFGFDSPLTNIFTVLSGMLYVIFLAPSGVTLTGIGYLFFARKRYIASIAICILSFSICIGTPLYHKIQEKSVHDKGLYEQGTLDQDNPPSGYLVPTNNFFPEKYKEKYRSYGNAYVGIVYEFWDADGFVSLISFSERGGNALSYRFYDETNVTYSFQRGGFPGNIKMQEKSASPRSNQEAYIAPGRVSYELVWKDGDDKEVRITVHNVSKSDFNLQKVESMLNELERTP